MMEYKSRIALRPARPRSKRLRHNGTQGSNSSSSVISVGGSQEGVTNGHTHINKDMLDTLRLSKGYLITEGLVERQDAEGNYYYEKKEEEVKVHQSDIASDLSADSPIRVSFSVEDLTAGTLTVTDELRVRTLMVNQAEARGGMVIDTAAYIQVNNVVDMGDVYACFFDTHNGTIANLFKVDDVAYCQRWTPENATLKFYKRRVLAVDLDCVILSKQDAFGDGKPEVGDIIIHYGNYTDKNRQYVKISDVVGGGYERYLEGLNSVLAGGKEFFFVGKQGNANARWFVGDKDRSNIEYKDGKLSLNNVALSVNSTVGGEAMPDYIKQQIGSTNLVLQSDARLESEEYTLVNYRLTENIEAGETYTLSVWASNPNADITLWVGKKYYYIKETLTEYGSISVTFTAPISTNEIGLDSFEHTIFEKVKLEKGTSPSEWTPANYVNSAFKESTTINGGLIATSLIQLGYSVDDEFVVQSGISGYADASKKDIAFWAGGNKIDAESDVPTAYATSDEIRPASYVVRHDGTGYMAGGAIKFRDGVVELGDSLRLSEGELLMYTGEHGKSFTVRAGQTGYADLESAPTPDETYTIQESVKSELLILKSPQSATYWVAPAFDSIYQPITNALRGGIIKLSLSLEFYVELIGSNPNIPEAWGFVTAQLWNESGEMVADLGQANWARTGTPTINGTRYARYACTLNSPEYAIPANGTYEIAIEGEVNTSSEPIRVDTISLSEHVATTLKGGEICQTIIGVDGFAANFGKSLIAVSKNGAALRCGTNWLRIDEQGITYMTNGQIKSLT